MYNGFYFFIPFTFIALIVLAGLVIGGAAVATVITFVLKHFVIISVVLWAVIILISVAIHNGEKGVTGKVYQLTSALSVLPLYLIMYQWWMEMNKYLLKGKYVSMIMDAVGGVFALALVGIIGLWIISLGESIREKGKIKTAIVVKILLIILTIAVMAFLLYKD